MKKVLALLLALVMVFGLVACGSSAPAEEKPAADADKPASSDAPAASEGGESAASGVATPNMNEDGSMNLDLIAHYDPNYDYSQNPTLGMAYCAASADVLYQQSADAFEHWCSKMNLRWDGFMSATGDPDLFMTNLQTAIDQGTTLFVLDPDITTYPSIWSNVLQPYVEAGEVFWMSQMGQARDYIADDTHPNGNLLAPFVGFDYFDGGRACAQWLVDWFKETYPDVPWSEVAFVSYTFSVSPPLDERRVGAEEVFLALDGVEKDVNYFICDTLSTSLTMQGAVDSFNPVLTTNSQYKYWLVFGLLDDLAMGAAQVLQQAGLTETSATNAIGGAGLQTQLDAGQETAFRTAYALPNLMYAEPLIGAIYAEAMGWCTADTLWPSWVKASDHGAGDHTYSCLPLPSWFITAENYKAFYSWVDDYADIEYYGYGEDFSGYDLSTIVTPENAPAGWLD